MLYTHLNVHYMQNAELTFASAYSRQVYTLPRIFEMTKLLVYVIDAAHEEVGFLCLRMDVFECPGQYKLPWSKTRYHWVNRPPA